MLFFLLIGSSLSKIIDYGESLKWTDCGTEDMQLECATLKVPMDYINLEKTIDIALNRKLAPIQPANTYLLFNPGGPGVSGLEFVKGFPTYYFDDVVDYIGFDIRGVGNSTPVVCTKSNDHWDAFMRDRSRFGTPFLPINPSTEELNFYSAQMELMGKYCLKHSGEYLAYLSTAYIARDMEEIRKALQMKELNYYGLSYGSILGVTYANMFPENVGRMMFDAIVNPIDYFSDFFKFLNGLQDLDETLEKFGEYCDELPFANCSLSKLEHGIPALTTIDNVIESLKNQPILVTETDIPAVVTAEYASMVLFESLYSASLYPNISNAFYQASIGNGLPMIQLLEYIPFTSPQTTPSNLLKRNQPGLATLCSDTDISTTHYTLQEWKTQIKEYSNHTSMLGSRQWGWKFLSCRTWPRFEHTDRYTGPWNKQLKNPVLIIGTRYDPVTPWTSAQILYDLMGKDHATNQNARLLLHNGHGHGSISQISSCTMDIQIDYVLYGRLPPIDYVCEVDDPLFTIYE